MLSSILMVLTPILLKKRQNRNFDFFQNFPKINEKDDHDDDDGQMVR